MDICTIIAKNYVAQARVLARSFAEHHPEGRCHVLVIDDVEGYIDPTEEPFELLTPNQIDCQPFEEMAHRYTVIELSTAVKPWLLRHLLAAGRPAITYLDPDIRIYGSLQRLEDAAIEHGLALTPHNTVPIPPDGERPTQIDILIAGVYNLGFVSMAPGREREALLDWWSDRLERDCRVDPVYGYFVDQRWFDLAPGLVSDFSVVREPEFNIAYWNAHSRRLEHDDKRGRYTVGGRPLAFFHFSGFDPEQPHLLSRHQTRVRASENPALLRIMREYAAETLDSGYAQASRWPYTWEMLPVGVRFDRALRVLYDAAREEGALTLSPFTAEGCAELLSWLAEPAPGAPEGVNRLVANLYGTRDDLREAFPDLAGGDLERLLHWLHTEGAREFPVLSHLPGYEAPRMALRDLLGPPPPPVPPTAPEPPWGVNVVGYFRSELGTGEAARQVVSALDAAGVPLLPLHGATVPPSRQGHAFQHLDHTAASFPVNLICMNADALTEFAGQAGPGFFRDRHSIGLWFWEVERFPPRWAGAFRHLDEVWLPTAHVAEAVAAVSPVPAHQVRMPVELPPLRPRSRAELGLPEGFVFLFSFDYHSVFARKNPLGVLEAFTRAFAPGEGPHLVIKSINGERHLQNHERLLVAAAGRPDVHVIDGYVSAEAKNAIAASADCYVSLHRSEGFGLTMAEAMYLGRPVIATGYSGNLDFMTSENSYLVDHRLIEIGHAPPYPSEARWADPDLDHAARLMREVVENPQAAAARGARAAADLRRTHSARAAGEVMAARLESVHAGRPAPAHASLPLTAPLAGRLGAGPVSARSGGRGRLRRRLRRLLAPHAAYQWGIDSEIARCLQLLDWRLQSAEQDGALRHAALLAELRRQRAHAEDELAADRDAVERPAALPAAEAPAAPPVPEGDELSGGAGASLAMGRE
jgi:glycosyltransferase involved in cell wall biosynthesis